MYPNQNIPVDVFTEIFKHAGGNAYPALRRVSQIASQGKVDIKVCCKVPSNYEIAKWIWNESQLLKHENSANFSLFNWNQPGGKRRDLILTFESAFSRTLYDHDWIELDLMTGELTGKYFSPYAMQYISEGRIKYLTYTKQKNIKFDSLQSLIYFLRGKHLILKYYPNSVIVNLDMIRDIMSQRKICSLHGISSEDCFRKLLIDNSVTDYQPS